MDKAALRKAGTLFLGAFVFSSHCFVLGDVPASEIPTGTAPTFDGPEVVHGPWQNESPQSVAVSLLKALLIDVHGSLTAERVVPEVDVNIDLASSTSDENTERLFRHADKISDHVVKHDTGPRCTLDTMVSICEHKYCNDGVCAYCRKDADCQIIAKQNDFQCIDLGHNKTMCRHPPLFDPFDWKDIVASFGIVLVCFLSAASGIGGGGVLVPLYVIVREMAPHDAVPLSKATTFGTAIANLIINLRERHPTADRPLIDFSTCALLVPCQLMGTVIGVIVNGIIPEWLITLLLFVMLLLMAVQTSSKGIKLYRQESKAPVEDLKGISSAVSPVVTSGEGVSPELAAILEAEKDPDLFKLGTLFVLWALLISIAFLKGGPSVPWDLNIKCGTWQWWVLVTAIAPASLFVMLGIGLSTNKEYQRKCVLKYRFADGDVHWTWLKCICWPLLCTTAGIASGALGLGGGTITSPIMLMMGMEPRVVAASAAFMILFTASSTTTQYLIVSRLQVDYAAWFFSIAFISCLVGHYLINALTKKSNKSAHVVFVLAGVVGASAIGIGLLGVMRFSQQLEDGANLGIKDLCHEGAHSQAHH